VIGWGDEDARMVHDTFISPDSRFIVIRQAFIWDEVNPLLVNILTLPR